MASLAKGQRLIKNLSPEMVNRGLAEWVLVQSGVTANCKCRVELQFAFDRGARQFKSCRVEVEIK